MPVPEWVQDAIFYQIFPDRFANGDLTNDPANVSAWDAAPTRWSFHGGDLRGIMQQLDYLVDLGINTIYLNPIFQSPSNHRYNTIDYFKIDPKLGSIEDFHALIKTAHQKDIRVILDGVFNHCGRGFFAFSDILENGEHSPYRDWFHIKRFPVDAYSPGEARDYLAWWNFKSLPKFNTSNQQVREYIFDVARYWIKQGADGWRLDVPNEIDDDEFWHQFRQIVKDVNPDAYLLGEIWECIPRWVGERTFDGLMNYPARTAILDFLKGRMVPTKFGDMIQMITSCYPRANMLAMYNQVGSHDTERILTMLNSDIERLKTAYLFLFSFPGAPAIYYGDEIGIEGGKDPDCRRTFEWDEARWNHELRDFVKQVIRLRKEKEALRRGDYNQLVSDDQTGIYAFCRSIDGQSLVTVLNGSQQAAEVVLSRHEAGWRSDAAVRDLVTGAQAQSENGRVILKLPAYGGAIFGTD